MFKTLRDGFITLKPCYIALSKPFTTKHFLFHLRTILVKFKKNRGLLIPEMNFFVKGKK